MKQSNKLFDKRNLNTFVFTFILVLIALVLFFKHISNSNSLLSSSTNLAQLLSSYANRPQDWACGDWACFKYRVLFRWVVSLTCFVLTPNVTPGIFYWVFVFWSFICTCGTILLIYFYLRILGNSCNWSFVGSILFVISFPILFAYNYPIFMREDPLAYLLVVLGMIATIKDRPFLMIIASMFGSLTRETILIIPFVYFVTSQRPIHQKCFYAFMPILGFIAIRLALGYNHYNPLSKGQQFWYNIGHPVETFFFLFLSFGFMWFLALSQWLHWWKRRHDTPHSTNALYKSAPWAFLLILLTNVFMAMVRENRISFLLFPWIIPLATFWLKSNYIYFKNWVLNNDLFPYLFIFIVLLGIALNMLLIFHSFIETTTIYNLLQRYTFGNHTSISKVIASYPDVRWWSNIMVLHVVITLMLVKFSLRAQIKTN